MSLSRRAFLRGTAATAAALGTGVLRPGLASARARTMAAAMAPHGTTLAVSLGLAGDSGYRRLTELPGWPLEVRADLADPSRGREDRREPLATIVHLTDIHVVDAQSPARVEFMDRYADQPTDAFPVDGAWRPQEVLSAHIADAMVRRMNAIGVGPVSGRPFDCAVSTGDNTDNQQYNELDWMLRSLDGGDLAVNSGDPERYEGVQDDDPTTFDDHYWHPGEAVHPVTGATDRYKRSHGFPTIPGLLAAAIAPFRAEGLRCPWYSCYGNHDGLLQGNAPAVTPLGQIATGPLKIVGLPAGLSPNDVTFGLQEGDPAILGALVSGPARPVTADEARRPVPPAEWAAIHLEDRGGPGPVGHGFDDRAVETGELYYTFDLGEGLLGVVLDTVARGGGAWGSLGEAQLQWLEEQLVAVHARHYDADGNEVRTGNDDRLVVLFSHHNIPTMIAPFPDPAMPADRRVLGDEVEAFLHRFPNVIAWVNGHSHKNQVWARPDPAGRSGGFWEVNTAAHIDAPQHARIVEVVDNHDGTLSIFGTLVDHAGPATVDHDDTSVLGLASLAREIAFNDPQSYWEGSLGTPADRNVELLITRPFARTAPTAPPRGRPADPPSPQPPAAPASPERPLPATGGGLGLAAGAAAIAAAAALRGRSGGG